MKQLFDGVIENMLNFINRINLYNERILVLIAATLILFIRKTDSFVNPQFWAEDGNVFFLQQYENGISAVFQPYAGYLLVAPRIIALIADVISPYSFLPAFYNYSCLVITLLVVLSVYSKRLDVNNKPLISLTIVLVPHFANEVFINITNIQWILALLLIIVLLKDIDNYHICIDLEIIIDFFIIVLCGLTGPFIVLLLPFFAYKYFKLHNAVNLTSLVLACIVSSVQLLVLIYSGLASTGKTNVNIDLICDILGKKMLGMLFLGMKIPYMINSYILCIIYIVLIYYLFKLAPKRNILIITISIHFVILMAVFFRFKSMLDVLVQPHTVPRYFYIPNVLLTWSLVSLMGEKVRWKNNMVKFSLILIATSSLTSAFFSGKYIDLKWQKYSELINKEEINIPINPLGWNMLVKVKPIHTGEDKARP